uniref:peptidylprolyl isomerase n=1 Tax=Arcella intermedia TaxID=1963864 RepID=A0A6B2L3D5_9EUKA
MKESEEESDSMSDVEEEEKAKDVTGDGGVVKEIMKAGEGSSKPASGSEVTVHYVGRLPDGTQFDSSRDRNEPFKFKLGEGQVIKGWEEVVKTMKKGEISKVTLKPEYGYGSAGSPPKIPPDATLVFEIELLSWEEEKDLTSDGGVLKKVLHEGKGWETPNYEATCTVRLTTRGARGEVLESAESREIVIGQEEITEGLEKALQSMKKGEHSIFKVKAKYAYGEKGEPQHNVPPNEDLQYEIEMICFEKGKESWELNTFEEKFKVALRRKEEGNKLFNSQRFCLALRKYENALVIFKYAADEKDHKKEIEGFKVDCYLNRVAVELKMGKYSEAVQHAGKALEIDARNVKALWRRGTAYQQNGDWVFARRDFERALEVDPDNKTVKSALVQLKKRIAEEDRKERVKYQNMFEKLALKEKGQEEEKANKKRKVLPKAKTEEQQGHQDNKEVPLVAAGPDKSPINQEI